MKLHENILFKYSFLRIKITAVKRKASRIAYFMWILARYSLGLHPYVSLNLVAKYWLVEKPQSIATSVIDRFSPGGDCSMIFFALLRRAKFNKFMGVEFARSLQ